MDSRNYWITPGRWGDTIHIAYAGLPSIILDTLEYLTQVAPEDDPLKQLTQRKDFKKTDIDFDLLFRIREFLQNEEYYDYANRLRATFAADAFRNAKAPKDDGCIYYFNSACMLTGCKPYSRDGKAKDVQFTSKITPGAFRFTYYYVNELDHFFTHLIVDYIKKKEKPSECWFSEKGLVTLWHELEHVM